MLVAVGAAEDAAVASGDGEVDGGGGAEGGGDRVGGLRGLGTAVVRGRPRDRVLPL